MPCNCDYMNPTRHEIESVRTAQSLGYVLKSIGEPVPEYVTKAKNSYYGDVSKLNDMVVMLCALLTNMGEDQINSIVYNGRKKEARILADWWEEHQRADKERIRKEKEEEKRKKNRESAIKKLTREEKKSLGIEED